MMGLVNKEKKKKEKVGQVPRNITIGLNNSSLTLTQTNIMHTCI